MKKPKHFSLTIEDQVAWLKLTRPDVHNAFDDALINELIDALEDLEDHKKVRCLVLCSEGASFSAGADLQWMQRMVEASEKQNRKDSRKLAKLMRRLNEFPWPTIARVQGAAFGGGVGLVACCDIAVASKSAKFGLSEGKLGLVPAVISPYVADAIGIRQCRRLFLTAETFDAEFAQRIGLVHEAVDDDQLDNQVAFFIKLMKKVGPEASKASKTLIRRIDWPQARERRELDEDNAELIARLRVSKEGQEGIKAFLDKRKPKWAE